VNINELVKEAHENAVAKGWWEGNEHNIPEKIALIHSEVSEALECFRAGEMKTIFKARDDSSMRIKKPEGFPSELADVIIRIADLCGHLEIDLEKEIATKMAYNKTRSYRHGGKRC
jgi:NTP pyrophosphatase (non-canonical NTP hydrolase)